MTSYRSLETDAQKQFIARHIGPPPADIDHMLTTIGFDDLDQMTKAIVPSNILMDRDMALAPAINETALLSHMRDLANENTVFTSLIGWLLWHDHTACFAPQYSRKSCLVYGLHTLSA